MDLKPSPEPEAEPQRVETGPADIRGTIIRLLMDEDKSAVQIRTEIARCVVLALSEMGQFFYHAELRDFDSAMFFDRQRRRLERVRSDAFLGRLSDWLAVNRADAVFKYVSAEVETAALAGAISKPILPEAFWASRPAAVHLSNGDGRAVRVTKAGPELVDNGADEVLFAAGRTCSPWTFAAPMDPFELAPCLRPPAAAPHGRDLFKLWALSLPTNPRSKPPICFAGEIGSGKTRTAKGLAELYGIPFVAAKVEKEKESEFGPATSTKGGLVTFDNADTKVPWLAMLSRIRGNGWLFVAPQTLHEFRTGSFAAPRFIWHNYGQPDVRKRPRPCGPHLSCKNEPPGWRNGRR